METIDDKVLETKKVLDGQADILIDIMNGIKASEYYDLDDVVAHLGRFTMLYGVLAGLNEAKGKLLLEGQ